MTTVTHSVTLMNVPALAVQLLPPKTLTLPLTPSDEVSLESRSGSTVKQSPGTVGAMQNAGEGSFTASKKDQKQEHGN